MTPIKNDLAKENNDHIQAAKSLIKTRLFIIQLMVDGRPVIATVDALVRLVLEMDAYTGQRFLEAKE